MEQKKFRTLIEIVTEAIDENEALDIAGEYLRGHIDGGVTMRCRAKLIKNGHDAGFGKTWEVQDKKADLAIF